MWSGRGDKKRRGVERETRKDMEWEGRQEKTLSSKVDKIA